MGFPSAIPCTDPNCLLCHGKGKYYRLDFSHTPEIPLRPQSPLEIAPLEIEEIACSKPAFDQVLDSILDEFLRFLPYTHRMQIPHYLRGPEEIRISLELRHFLDERR